VRTAVESKYLQINEKMPIMKNTIATGQFSSTSIAIKGHRNRKHTSKTPLNMQYHSLGCVVLWEVRYGSLHVRIWRRLKYQY
jgi:hypothetical protein